MERLSDNLLTAASVMLGFAMSSAMVEYGIKLAPWWGYFGVYIVLFVLSAVAYAISMKDS